MGDSSKYYDELFGTDSEDEQQQEEEEEEEEAEEPPPQRVSAPSAPARAPAPAPSSSRAPADDFGSDGSASDDSDSESKPRKRLNKAGKKSAGKVRRQDTDDEDDDEEAEKPRPTMGYEEEEQPNEKGMEDSDDEEYREDSDEEQIKKKKGKGKKGKAKLQAIGGGGGGGGGRGGGGGKTKGEKDMVDIAIEKIKKRRVKDPTDDELKAACEEIVEIFERALREDRIAMERGKPALAKLTSIDTLLRLLGNKRVQDAMIEKFQLLAHIKSWIKPMDKTKELPLHAVRSKLIEYTYHLPVEVDQLKESGIGKVVQQLVKHKDETLPNKQMLKRIIEKWSNVIMAKSQAYRNQSIDDDEERGHRRHVESTAPTYFESHTSRGVKIARRTGFNFKKMPTPKERVSLPGAVGVGPRRDDEAEEVLDRDDDGGEINEQGKKELLRKRMAELSRKPNTKKLRAANVSTH